MVLKKLFGKRDSEQNTQAVSHTQSEKQDALEPSSQQPEQSAPQPAGDNPEPKAAEFLEQAMVENVRQDNGETRRKVYQELLFSELLLALSEPEAGASAADAGTDQNQNMSVAILQNSAGTPFAAAFTSGAAARRWRPDGGQYVSVRGQDIFKLLEPSPAEVIVINPGGAPFIVLPKVEYRQLAMGIVPQTQHSPVQMAAGTEGAAGGAEQDGQMQVAFPPDVFSDEQKDHSKQVLNLNEKIEAAVLGAILPPNAGENGWIRTIFLRVKGLEESPDAMQSFCTEVKNNIVEDKKSLFESVQFEVGVMPDPAFWQAMHQNGIVLFDKNPPPAPAASSETKEGVVEAHLEA